MNSISGDECGEEIKARLARQSPSPPLGGQVGADGGDYRLEDKQERYDADAAAAAAAAVWICHRRRSRWGSANWWDVLNIKDSTLGGGGPEGCRLAA